MRVAREVSTWSRDPSTQVGAIMVRDRRVIATGYNGFPQGMADDDRLNGKEEKYARIIHAEMNALMNALKFGVSSEGATLYCYGLPVCSNCMKAIIQAGVRRVVIIDPDGAAERWRLSWLLESKGMLDECGVEYEYLTKEQLDG